MCPFSLLFQAENESKLPVLPTVLLSLRRKTSAAGTVEYSRLSSDIQTKAKCLKSLSNTIKLFYRHSWNTFLVQFCAYIKQKQNKFIKMFEKCYTANIFNVSFTVFKCVPISTVISLYGLHLIAAQSTVE